jgi:hypothetical protein
MKPALQFLHQHGFCHLGLARKNIYIEREMNKPVFLLTNFSYLTPIGSQVHRILTAILPKHLQQRWSHGFGYIPVTPSVDWWQLLTLIYDCLTTEPVIQQSTLDGLDLFRALDKVSEIQDIIKEIRSFLKDDPLVAAAKDLELFAEPHLEPL